MSIDRTGIRSESPSGKLFRIQLVSATISSLENRSVKSSPESETADVSSTANRDQTVEIASDSTSTGLASDAVNSIKGFCMGVCDAVPGVSGGTVALIVGIYERLFVAISHIDTRLFHFLRKREWSQATRHVDLRFLFTLIIGLGIGYVVMSIAIKELMASDTLRTLTLASFAGMVVGSIVLVFSKIEAGQKEKIICVFCALIGCALSAFIALQNTAAATGEVALPYLFLCTVVAICAMILPGISGAMLLLIFGVYYYVLEIPRNLIHFENVGENLIRLAVVLGGCIFGLLVFGRTIKWFLHNHRAKTLSTMLGLMIGSLIVLWPFQNRIEPLVEHHKPTYEAFWPTEFGLVALGAIGCLLLFGFLVIAVDRRVAYLAAKKQVSSAKS